MNAETTLNTNQSLIQLTGLLSEKELEEIGITSDMLKNPTEDVIKKIQDYFKKLNDPNK